MYNFFKEQPDEILVEIFKYLTYVERMKLREVDKRFKNIVAKPALGLSEQEKLSLPAAVIDALCDIDSCYLPSSKDQPKNSKEQVNQFKELIAMGADPNMTEGADTSNRWTPIHNNHERSLLEIAAYTNKIDLAKLLLKKNVNVNYQDNDGWTALHFAVRQGHAKLAKLLLDHGADPNLEDMDGRTPVGFAEFYVHELAENDPYFLKIMALVEAVRSNSGWENLIGETNDEPSYVVSRACFN